MASYLVTWKITVDEANSPEEAAIYAVETHFFQATSKFTGSFIVTDKDTKERYKVDLEEEEDFE